MKKVQYVLICSKQITKLQYTLPQSVLLSKKCQKPIIHIHNQFMQLLGGLCISISLFRKQILA